MNFWNRLRLGTRLLTGFLAVVVIGAAVAGVGIHGLARINDFNDRLYNQELLGLSYVKEANISLVAAGRARANFALATNDQERKAARESFDKSASDFNEWVAKAKPLFYSEAGKALVGEVEGAAQKWIPAGKAFLDAAAGKDLQAADPELQRLDRTAKEMNQALDDKLGRLAERKEAQSREAAQEGSAVYKRTTLLMVVLTSVSAVLGVLIGVVLTRGITRQLGGEPQDVAAVATAIAAGDLTTHVDTSRAVRGSSRRLRTGRGRGGTIGAAAGHGVAVFSRKNWASAARAQPEGSLPTTE